MCVIFVAYNQRADFPLVVAANRDEFYSRPTAAARRWDDYPFIVAGRDLVGKGTWLGITDNGRFAAVTNYRDPGQPKGSRSRGDLVADFLKTNTPVRDYLEAIAQRKDEYTGFNLIAGEINAGRSELYYYSNQNGPPRKLDSGIFGLSNHLLDTPWPKVKRGKSVFGELVEKTELVTDSFFKLLSDKTKADDDFLPETGVGIARERLLSPIFIETPIYGTRCSTVVTIDEGLKPRLDERIFVH